MINEKLGIPDFLYKFSYNLFEDIVEKLDKKNYQSISNKSGTTYKMNIKKNDKMVYHKEFDYDNVLFYLEVIDSDKYKFKSASFVTPLRKMYGKAFPNTTNVDLANKRHKEIEIRLTIESKDDIHVIMENLIDNMDKIVSVIAHEVFHSFDALKDNHKLYNSLDAIYNEASLQFMAKLNIFDEFLKYIYLSYSFELKAHLVELGIDLQMQKIKKKDFLSFLNSNKTYKEMKEMRDLTYDDFYNNIKTDLDVREQLVSFVRNPDDILDMSSDQIKMILLRMLKKSIIDGVIDNSIIPRNFYDDADFKRRGKVIINQWAEDLGHNKDIKTYFNDWIKKFNNVGRKYTKKMSKVYALTELKHIKSIKEYGL